MKVSREWATPLTIGAFCLMALTGILMFFHLDTGLNKTAHEWLGWVMVGGVACHAAANWQAFKRHFLANAKARVILILSTMVIAGSFISPPGAKDNGPRAPMLALNAILHAPLSQVAQLAGQPTAQVVTRLRGIGLQGVTPDSNLESLVGKDRDVQSKALRAIFTSV